MKGGGTNASLSGEEESETDSDLQKSSNLANGHARLSTASQTSEDEIRSQAPGQGQEIRVWRGWQEPEQDSEGHRRAPGTALRQVLAGAEERSRGSRSLLQSLNAQPLSESPFVFPVGVPFLC